MARCSDMILATAESFDCAVIHLNHTVMSRTDDYAGSDDAGCAGRGSVLVLKDRETDSWQCTCTYISRGDVSGVFTLLRV